MGEIEAAEVVLPCAELEATLAFFTGRLGFRIAAVFPANAPTVAVVTGHGLRIRLDRGASGPPGTLRLLCREPAAFASGAASLEAPNGTRVELAEWRPAVRLPALRPSFVLTRLGDGVWTDGRAGMRYRDLIPDRQGGRFVASHIRIAGGGPVPDYVHYHRVRFQLIYCASGSVRVVYEDQGPPFELGPGDAVLQPPEIRHRVLACSPGLEVIELASPADHETLADLELELPTDRQLPDRDFAGQRFARHQAMRASFEPWRISGLEARDLGIEKATSGLASAEVVRRSAGRGEDTRFEPHAAELLFGFVLAGRATLRVPQREPEPLSAGAAFVVPAGLAHELRAASADFELLRVSLSASGTTG